MKWINGWSIACTFEDEFSNVTQSYASKVRLALSIATHVTRHLALVSRWREFHDCRHFVARTPQRSLIVHSGKGRSPAQLSRVEAAPYTCGRNQPELGRNLSVTVGLARAEVERCYRCARAAAKPQTTAGRGARCSRALHASELRHSCLR